MACPGQPQLYGPPKMKKSTLLTLVFLIICITFCLQSKSNSPKVSYEEGVRISDNGLDFDVETNKVEVFSDTSAEVVMRVYSSDASNNDYINLYHDQTDGQIHMESDLK